jgi:hypothetical protein
MHHLRFSSTAIHGLVLSVAAALLLQAQTVHAGWFNLLPSELPETPMSEWEVVAGDSLVVDTKLNIGYLVHKDGGYTSFPVASGQRRVVRYIGRTYNATTPARRWTMVSNERKGDRITFGPEGTFLRLSYDGEETPYGVHTHAYVEAMLSSQERYKSMGCIIVSKPILDVIELTFSVNGGTMDVVTVQGFGDEPVNYVTLMDRLN